MCLTTLSIKLSKAQLNKKFVKIASRNIIVFKILDKTTNKSPYYHMKYEPRGLCKSRLKIVYNENYLDVNNGLHAYTTKRAANKRKDYYKKIVEMTIPKGSKYIIGYNNTIVSNQLL